MNIPAGTNWHETLAPEKQLDLRLLTSPEYQQDEIIELLERHPKIMEASLANQVLPKNVFMRSVQTGAVNIVSYLLNNKADANMVIADTTPLQLAVDTYINPKQFRTFRYLRPGFNPSSYIKITNLLVDHGAQVTPEILAKAQKKQMPDDTIQKLEKALEANISE